MAYESLTFDQLTAAANRLGQAATNLNDLQAEFRNVTSEIGASGSELGGEFGDFVKCILDQEINAKLVNLTGYVEELKKAVELVARSNEEATVQGEQIISDIK